MTDNPVTEIVLYVVVNEEGDITADMDRDNAFERMRDDYGGETFRVLALTVHVPRPRDYIASITLPEEGGETIKVNF